MPDGLTIARDLAAKRERVVRGMSPMAKHQRFPQLYATPLPQPSLPHELKAEIARLTVDNDKLRAKLLESEGTIALLQARINGAPAEAKAPTVEAIAYAFCVEFNRAGGSVDGVPLSRAHFRSARRTKALAQPRQAAMWLCRELTEASYPQIAHVFGGRDHTTVMHACGVVQYVFAMRPDIKAAADAVLARFKKAAP